MLAWVIFGRSVKQPAARQASNTASAGAGDFITCDHSNGKCENRLPDDAVVVRLARMKVSAAMLVAPGDPFRVETVELAEPRAEEVLVRVAAVGVCHSDWNLVTGATRHPMPVVPGHEGAGVVEAIGPGVQDV